jgi:2-keto-4-pentenoate hydratase/2-oxohepta-3-ene-1,7-dioic acid hydratase in catechol pathway
MTTHNTIAKYVRFAIGDTVSWGVLGGDADETVRELDGNFIGGASATGRSFPLAQVRLVSPCLPSKVLAIGRNYKSHLGERELPSQPAVFIKLPSSIVGPGDDIVIPPGARNVHHEAELVIVIGKKASRISKEEVPDVIFGFTAGNDVSERDWQKNDVQWFRAKASDTFAPLGPCVVTGLDPRDLLVQCRINGETRQSQSTKDFIFDVATMVSFVSQYATLLPGDLLFTGTPGKTMALQPGDIVEVEVQGVGILSNRVRAW